MGALFLVTAEHADFFLGALPPTVGLRAVCFVRTMVVKMWVLVTCKQDPFKWRAMVVAAARPSSR